MHALDMVTMPDCRRCGKNLVPADVRIQNWSRIQRKDFYSCQHCGGIWLYSKSLNCPILVDPRNVVTGDPERVPSPGTSQGTGKRNPKARRGLRKSGPIRRGT